MNDVRFGDRLKPLRVSLHNISILPSPLGFGAARLFDDARVGPMNGQARS